MKKVFNINCHCFSSFEQNNLSYALKKGWMNMVNPMLFWGRFILFNWTKAFSSLEDRSAHQLTIFVIFSSPQAVFITQKVVQLNNQVKALNVDNHYDFIKINSPAIRGATHGCPLAGTSSINIKIEIFSTVPVGRLSECWGITGQAALVAQTQRLIFGAAANYAESHWKVLWSV